MERVVEIKDDFNEPVQYYQGIPVHPVLCRPKALKGLVHQSCTVCRQIQTAYADRLRVAQVDTRDHEDHTFNGMMFNIACCKQLPVQYLQINSIWIRGR